MRHFKPMSSPGRALCGAVALAATALGLCGVARADLIGVDIPSITSAGKSNNDDVGLTVAYLRTYFNNPSIIYLGTFDGPGNDAPSPPAGEIISVSSLNGGLNGTWSSNLDLVYAFDVKAANDNALEGVAPPALSGTWSTSDVVNNGGQHPDVSHIDFFGIVAVVPAPLVGHGLPALIAIGVLLAGFGLWEHNNKRPLQVSGVSATNCSGVGLRWSRFLGAFVGSALFGFGLLRRRNLSSRCGPPFVHERGA